MYCSMLKSYVLYMCVFLKVLFSAQYVCQSCLLCYFVNDVLNNVNRLYQIFKINLHIVVPTLKELLNTSHTL